MLRVFSVTATCSNENPSPKGSRELCKGNAFVFIIFKIIKGPWANWIILKSLPTIDRCATEWEQPLRWAYLTRLPFPRVSRVFEEHRINWGNFLTSSLCWAVKCLCGINKRCVGLEKVCTLGFVTWVGFVISRRAIIFRWTVKNPWPHVMSTLTTSEGHCD